ncbi:MAG: CvpA family protein [Oscillospiraceae bacterium]|nr:CvpA family protein [Oscillospiraceae bacterium]
MAYVIDGILIAVVVYSIANGARKGLVKSLFGLFGVVIALLGAIWATKQLSPYLAEYLSHSIEENVVEQFQDKIQSVQNAAESSDAVQQAVPEVIRGYGFYEMAVDELTSLIENAVSAVTEEIVPALARETAQQISALIARVIVFIIIFIGISLILSLLSKALGIMTKLPVVKEFNAAGGAILGAVKALILIGIFAWTVRYLGFLIPQSLVDKTLILKYFVDLI